MAALGGGWTVIQRHYDYSLNFAKNWTDYTLGFGSLSANHYLGNQWIDQIVDWSSTNLPYRLAVVLEDTTGEKRTTQYQTFWLGSNYEFYYYTYNPDNDFESGGDSMYNSNGAPFQTQDHLQGRTCSSYRSPGILQNIPINHINENKMFCRVVVQMEVLFAMFRS